MRQFFEIIIYKYYKWTSRREKDLFVCVSKITAILGLMNLLQFFALLSVIYPPLGMANPKVQNYLLMLCILLSFGAINYFIFFKGKGMPYYISKCEGREKWWHTIYAILYPVASLAVLALSAVITKNPLST